MRPMAIAINDGFMRLETGGQVIVTARQRPGHWRQASRRPGLFDSTQIIVARTATRAAGCRPRLRWFLEQAHE